MQEHRLAEGIANDALGRITRIDQEKGTVNIALDTGPTFTTPWQQLRQIEYGYATTSHSSQGATVEIEPVRERV